VATVGPDDQIPDFYISDKLGQFTHSNNDPVYAAERFLSSGPAYHPEVCDTEGATIISGPTIQTSQYSFRGNYNALVPAQNAGFFEWTVVLPKNVGGNLNFVLQCGVLMPSAFTFLGFDAVELCAGETGERIGAGFCTRLDLPPNINPVVPSLLPTLTIMASPGPYATPDFTDPFYLTGFRTPSNFQSGSLSIYDGGFTARVLLKACQSETVIAKIPITGQDNPLSEKEYLLSAGDRIAVRLDIPPGHTMDVYCHRNSLRIQGNGDPQTFLP
jgi:hypothetical protein